MAVSMPDNISISVGKPLDAKTVKQTIAERDAIPMAQRYRGMVVHVTDAGGGVSKRYWLAGANLSVWTELEQMTETQVNTLIQTALGLLTIDAGEVV